MDTERLCGASLVAVAHAARAGDRVSRERVCGAVAGALLASGGSRTHAARALGIGRVTLARWLAPPSPDNPQGLDLRAAIGAAEGRPGPHAEARQGERRRAAEALARVLGATEDEKAK